MSRDRDDRDLPHEPEADEAEKGRAESFAELIDGLVGGAQTPPALTPDNRDLLEVATMIRATHHDVELPERRRDRLIERAFADALDLQQPAAPTAPLPADVIPLRRRALRVAPWIATTVAAAAAIFLALDRPQPTTHTVVVQEIELSEMHRSRPADPLIGRIDPADSGQASERLDIIFADRMTGYRDLKLRGINPKRGGRR